MDSGMNEYHKVDFVLLNKVRSYTRCTEGLPIPDETLTWKPFPNPATGYSTLLKRQN